MNKDLFRAKLKEEMRHIPEDGDDQNSLRMFYSLERRGHIDANGDDYPASETLKKAMVFCRKHGHGQAVYDEVFFRV